MIPINGNILPAKPLSSHTYGLGEENVRGYVDGKEAIEQAIYKILMTERYEYAIYSFNYGVELNKVIGRGKAEAKAMLPRIIGDALCADVRISEVKDFEFYDVDKTSIRAVFNAVTSAGEILGEVVINV